MRRFRILFNAIAIFPHRRLRWRLSDRLQGYSNGTLDLWYFSRFVSRGMIVEVIVNVLGSVVRDLSLMPVWVSVSAGALPMIYHVLVQFHYRHK